AAEDQGGDEGAEDRAGEQPLVEAEGRCTTRQRAGGGEGPDEGQAFSLDRFENLRGKSVGEIPAADDRQPDDCRAETLPDRQACRNGKGKRCKRESETDPQAGGLRQ